jgi:PAS domain S-box-containing protein
MTTRRRRSAVALAAIVALVAVVVSLSAAAVLRNSQQKAIAQQFEQRVSLLDEVVSAQIGRYVDTLSATAAAVGALTPVTPQAFRDATAPIAGMRLPGATSISFVVPATDATVASVQRTWRTRGAPDLVLHPQGTGHEHFFGVVTRVLDGRAPVTGADAARQPVTAQALVDARRTGRITVTRPVHLLRDRALPPDRQQLSFILVAPVFGAADAQGRQEFRGWVGMGLRGQDFVAAALRTASLGLLDATLQAETADGDLRTVATMRAPGAGHRDLHRRIDIAVGDQRWHLQVDTMAAALPGYTDLPLASAVSGILLGVLLAGLVYVLATSRARATDQVAAATAELRSSEAGIRRHAALLDAVLDSISDGVGVVDQSGEFLLQNRAARQMLGVAEDVAGQENWPEHYGVFTPDGRTPFPAADLPLVHALAGRSVEQVPMVIRNPANPDGLIVSVSARPLDPAAGQSGAVAVFHDITQRARGDRELAAATAQLSTELAARQAAEAQLRAARDDLATQRAYLAQILDAIDVVVITCDTTGALVHTNRAARHPDGTPLTVADAALRRSLGGAEVDAEEMVQHRPDGTQQVMLLQSRPLRDHGGRIVGAVASGYDITALREREAELAAFAGVVAHDLKNPLAAIAGFTELAITSLPPVDGVTDTLAIMERVIKITQRMRQLIDDLLSYAEARDAALTIAELDLGGLVDDVLADRLSTVDFDSATPRPQVSVGPLPPVLGDAAMLRQLFDNLIGNALKYTPPGQAAHIDIAAELLDGEQVRVTIADRGIGIPEGQHGAIFDKFHRAHRSSDYTGTGLGLAICQRIVQRHGGEITATDDPSGGARFLVTLPVTTSVRTA